MTDSPWITPDWPAPRHVRAASTYRTGGASVGVYDSFNLAAHVGDHPAAVLENRRRLRLMLDLPAEPCWLQQVHGTAVATAGWYEHPPTADACILDATAGQRGVCAVLTADCLPVLFADRHGLKLAVAHAGWRGLAGGVLQKTVEALRMPPEQLYAWLGPAIGPDAFEVGRDVLDAFSASHADARKAFHPNERGRWLADLYALARLELTRIGVRDIFGGGQCTVRDPGRFFSYRRDGQTGRMATLVWLE